MTDNLKAVLKSILLVLWIAHCYVPVWIAKKIKKPLARDVLVRWCYAGILRITGIRLTISGHLAAVRPLLLVTNHLSYLDVVILGAAAPVRFTPKSEISSWPVIGGICRMCDAVFIDRRPEKISDMKQSLETALAGGNVISLFPEGSTGNGLHLLPFRSGFFSLAEEPIAGRELTVQPAAIHYTHIRRLPIDTTQWPHIAWYGDMQLVPHLLSLLKLGPINAELVFLPPVALSRFGDRKQLANHCQQAIGEAIGR